MFVQFVLHIELPTEKAIAVLSAAVVNLKEFPLVKSLCQINQSEVAFIGLCIISSGADESP